MFSKLLKSFHFTSLHFNTWETTSRISGLEAVGAVASIVQLATTVYNISRVPYALSAELSSALSDIQDLAHDLEAFWEEIHLLLTLLTGEKNTLTRSRGCSLELLAIVQSWVWWVRWMSRMSSKQIQWWVLWGLGAQVCYRGRTRPAVQRNGDKNERSQASSFFADNRSVWPISCHKQYWRYYLYSIRREREINSK